MLTRSSTAVWEGGIKNGKGKMRIGKGIWEGNYSFASRFEQGAGTNPEELIAAAHAGCFSMALSLILEQAGFKPRQIATTAKVHVDRSGDGYKIMRIDLETEGSVPGLDAAGFREKAELAKKGCPVSVALSAVEINLVRVELAKSLAA